MPGELQGVETYARYKYSTVMRINVVLFSQVAEVPGELEDVKTYARYKYPRMVKKQGNFKLTVEPGEFTDSQIVVMLGENGTGKTTFIRMLVRGGRTLHSTGQYSSVLFGMPGENHLHRNAGKG